MKQVENKHNINLEELLRQKYVDENKPVRLIAEELDVGYCNIVKWLNKAGIYSRKLKI